MFNLPSFFFFFFLLVWEVSVSQSVQSLSHVWLFVTPWITAHQASLSITNSWSSLKLMSIKSVIPSSHLILCCPLLLLPPIPPSIRVFPNESNLCMRWPKYLSFSFNISPSNVDISFSLFSFWDPYMWMLILPQDNLNSSHFLNLFFYFAFLTRQFPWFFLIT